jgi:regulator of sirC expression with transglutaminase-like and TPR domain
MEHLWPALIGVAVGNRAPWPVKALWQWMHGAGARRERQVSGEVSRLMAEITRQAARITDLEDLIDLLRKALDKHLMRESAVANAAQFIVAIIQLVPEPTADMMRLRDQAEQLLRDARAHVASINDERRG